MSSFRVTPAGRALEPGHRGTAVPADPATTSFPEALGSAVNAPEMTQIGRGGSSATHERQQNAAEKESTGGSTVEPGDQTAAETLKGADLHAQHRRKPPSSLGAIAQASATAVATTMLSGSGPEPAAQPPRLVAERPGNPVSPEAESVAAAEPAGISATDLTRTVPPSAANELISEMAAPRDLPIHKDTDFVAAIFADAAERSFAISPAVSTAQSEVRVRFDALQGTPADAGSQAVPAPLVAKERTAPPPAHDLPEETGTSFAAVTIRGANLIAGPSADQSRAELSLNNRWNGGLAASTAPLASGVGLIDPAGDGARLDAADASPTQPAARNTVVRSQGGAPDEPVSTLVPQFAVVSASQEPGGAVQAPPPSALRNSEDQVRAAVPNLVVDVHTAETGNAAPGGLPGAASSPSSAANSFPADLSAQLFHHVMGSVGNGGQEVVLRLDPPELGDLTVRVLVHGREVSAWFATPQIQVQQAISQAIGQLQTDLGNAGYNLNSASVGTDAWSPSGSPGERDEGSQTSRQQGAVNRPSAEKSPGRPRLSSASGVSIYV